MSEAAPGGDAARLVDEINSCFDALRRVTARLVDTPSAAAIERALGTRESLLRDIAAKKAALEKIATPQALSVIAKHGRIHRQATVLAALDAVIAARMTSRLGEIKRVLSGLWNASNAAKAYLRHARS